MKIGSFFYNAKQLRLKLKTWSQKVTWYQSPNTADLQQAQAFAEDNTRSWEDIEAELGGQKLQGPSTCLDVSWSKGLVAETSWDMFNMSSMFSLHGYPCEINGVATLKLLVVMVQSIIMLW